MCYEFSLIGIVIAFENCVNLTEDGKDIKCKECNATLGKRSGRYRDFFINLSNVRIRFYVPTVKKFVRSDGSIMHYTYNEYSDKILFSETTPNNLSIEFKQLNVEDKKDSTESVHDKNDSTESIHDGSMERNESDIIKRITDEIPSNTLDDILNYLEFNSDNNEIEMDIDELDELLTYL